MKKLLRIHQSSGMHWVGDGFPVRSVFGYNDLGRDLSPFLLLDYAAPYQFPPGNEKRGVGGHPHKGFETVTVAYQGELEHRDSSGGGGKIGAGDVQWMTAGNGIVHEEFHSQDFTRKGGTLQMVQLWVNLRAKDKTAKAGYQTLLEAQIPNVELPQDAGTVRVIAGDFGGREGAAKTFTPINVWDVNLHAGKSAELPLPDGHTTTFLVLSGEIEVDGKKAGEGDLAIFERAGNGIAVKANTEAKLLVMDGEPIAEPVVGQGPFVMNSRAEIQQAFEDFQLGRMGELNRPDRKRTDNIKAAMKTKLIAIASTKTNRMKPKPKSLTPWAVVLWFTALVAVAAQAADKKPNILVLWGDDIGIANISAYSDGVMGYTTPNIDRIAKEGLRFLHYYGEQSCTAGRAAFLTGQHGIRSGMTKVGFPGAPMGMNQLDPSIGGLLKNLGYGTGQFGKNHLGDRNPSLPTVNGFDEFFGNLYHLNAEEEPELPDYPKDPEYLKKFGPRGVLRCKATDRDDPTVDPRFGKIGKQTIEDTGALTKKRMETVDDETSAAAIDFIKRQNAAGKPFFCWFNATRMHLRTHVRAGHRGRYQHGDSEYIDGMIEHDETIGSILKTLDDLGIANNTILVYSSDNGPHMNTWPDGAMTPFRSEKNTCWEGAFRVPCLVRWPGVIKPGTVTTELMSHNDWIPTLCAVAGEPDIVNKLRQGYTANGISYKVHLDGYDQSTFLRSVSGTVGNERKVKSARDMFFYSDDDGALVAMRQGDYKYLFEEQRSPGTMQVWAEPFTKLRLQKIYNLFMDPYERADITSNTFWDWQLNHVAQMYGVMNEVFQFAETFKEFPPRSVPPSFNPATILDDTLRDIKVERRLKAAFPMLKEEAPK